MFKIEQIKALLEKDKIEEALKILRGQFQEENEVIVQLSRLTHSNRDNRMGQMTRDEAKSERAIIISDVLAMLKEWDGMAD